MGCFVVNKLVDPQYGGNMSPSGSVIQDKQMEGMQYINKEFQIDKNKLLGKGNYGKVFKGFHIKANRIIAVKLISNEKLKEVKEWERELKVMSSLTEINHPNVMGYYGYQKKEPDGLYMFIEFCQRGSLKQFFTDKKKMSEMKVYKLFKQLISTMTAMNKLNLIHRDLKPDNIMLDEHEDLKIADFGLARSLGVDMTKGACTPLYAAPEMLNMQNYTQTCDVWSAGLILYEMLMGKEMFNHVRTKVALFGELEKFMSPNKRIAYPKDINPCWETITLRMMTYDKEKRPKFGELIREFQTEHEPRLKVYLAEKFGEFQQFQEGKEGEDLRITKSLSPYQPNFNGNKNDAKNKYKEEKSFQNINNTRFYNIFLRAKNDYRIKIIKDFTNNTYGGLKNVYKYVLMFLATCSYVAILNETLKNLKAGRVFTPNGEINAQEENIIQQHLEQYRRLLEQFIKKDELSLIKLKKKVLESQIISKIMDTYMTRAEENSILTKECFNLLDLIKDITNDKVHSKEEYQGLFVKIAQKPAVKVATENLPNMNLTDLKTYAQIVITANIDKVIPNEQFRNTDFVSLTQQEIESMSAEDLIKYIRPYN